MSGQVTFVGAGPGDPGLLTCRGRDALAEADVVLHDSLVEPRLLAHCRHDCALIAVGKIPAWAASRRGLSAAASWPQQRITAELIAQARAGRRVVRLKHGDSFIYGRGGEEALALAEAEIRFAVVPGVSALAAVPAYAGIPVTHRDRASYLLVATGHEDPTKGRSDIPWDSLAAGRGTLIVYMGVRRLPRIAERLLAAGLPADTPAACIEWGTTARQRTVTAPLGALARVASERGVSAPALIVIGRVVELRDKLAWFERQPLFGQRIVVTSGGQSGEALCGALAAAGASPLPLPTFRYGPLAQGAARDRLDATLDRLDELDALVFSTANAVRFAIEALLERGRDTRALAGLPVVSAGRSTAAALRRHGLLPDAEAAPGAAPLAERLGAALATIGRPERLLMPISASSDGSLARQLGAQPVVSYRVEPLDAPPAADALLADGVDRVLFTAAHTPGQLLAMLPDDGRQRVLAAPAISLGRGTTQAARSAGFTVSHQAPESTLESLLATVIPGLARPA